MKISVIFLSIIFLALSSAVDGSTGAVDGSTSAVGGSTGAVSSRRRASPQVLTSPGHFQGHPGDSIALPCSIKNVGSRRVNWVKGTSASGRRPIMQVKKARRKFIIPKPYRRIIREGKLGTAGTDLVIHHLTPEDTDSYTCSIARHRVTHTLQVLEAESVVEEPSPYIMVVYDPPTMRAYVVEGETTTLSCEANGHPAPTVLWRRQNEEQVLSEGPTLHLVNIRREDAGYYFCSASNGVLDPQERAFYLQVKLSADVWVEAEVSKVVVASEEPRALLTCQIKGHPKPKVTWYTDEGPVYNDTGHYFFSKDDLYYLQLENMTPLALGDYKCRAHNEAGEDSATITVEATPGPVQVLEASPTSTYGLYNITWEVESLAPVDYYFVSYNQEGSSEVERRTVSSTPQINRSGTHYTESTLVDLTPGITYHLTVRAVAKGHLPGLPMEENFFFTASDPASAHEMSDGTWNLLKSALTVISRLPKVVRDMQ
nr:cell adhesion molecule DSCAM-like isoform X1 [Cherax quadricarinatus]